MDIFTSLKQQLTAIVAEQDMEARMRIGQQILWQFVMSSPGAGAVSVVTPEEVRETLYPRNQKVASIKNEKSSRSKFTDEMLDELWGKYEAGEKSAALAAHFQCNINTIYNQICKLKKERGGNASAKKAKRPQQFRKKRKQ